MLLTGFELCLCVRLTSVDPIVLTDLVSTSSSLCCRRRSGGVKQLTISNGQRQCRVDELVVDNERSGRGRSEVSDVL